MKYVKTEIIAIGTELLLGQVANTNAQWLSQQLAFNGIDTYFHTVVGDNLIRVDETFRQAQKRSDVIIVSGGLGPTDDDMTREAFQRVSNLEMSEHKPSIKKIENFFEDQETIMTPNNRKQARVFNGATVIDNQVGMAPGMIVNYKNKTWIFLPGVPSEMKQMVKNDVLPFLITQSGHKMIIQSMILRFIGIGEARLEHELQDIIRSQKNPTIAPLAESSGLIIRLTAKASSMEEANKLLEHTKKQIFDKVGNFIYGINDETLVEKVLSMLREQQKRISAAESLTGGKFTEKLISVKGASDVCPGGIVCYDTNVKTKLLNVSPETINTHGVVSEACAKEMAKNICTVFGTDIGISFTGVAGPGSLEGHQVGTVYIAVYSVAGGHSVKKFLLRGDRESIRNRATLKGYEILFDFLKNGEVT